MRSLRTFYILIATQTLSLIGSQMSNFAISLWVYQETGDTTPLLYTSFFTFLPQMLAGSLAGVLADRWNRRLILMVTDAGQALPTLALALAFLSGNFAVWQLYLATLISAVFQMIQRPAADASVAMLVPDDQRNRANALRQLSGPAAGIIAPPLAGVLYVAIGVSGVIFIDFLTFITAVLVISLIHIPQPEKTALPEGESPSFWREFRGGLAFLWARPSLLAMIIYAMLLNFMLIGPATLTPAYVLTLTGSERFTGIALGLMSAGAIAGGISLGIVGNTKRRVPYILTAIFFIGLFVMLYGVMRTSVGLAVAMFAIMFPLPIANALLSSILQTKVPPDMQGRVFSVLDQLATFAMPISLLVAGPLIDGILEPAVDSAGWSQVAPLVGSQAGAGMGLYIVGCGFMIVIMTLVAATSPAIRQMESRLPSYATPEKTPDEISEGVLTGAEVAPAAAGS